VRTTASTAFYCSNHGGRQANGGLPALEALPAVVEAADGVPVLFDSGARSGANVAKALALGATAVGVGRPYVYALAADGADGVVSQLHSLLAELDLLMAVDGYPSIADQPRRLHLHRHVGQHELHALEAADRLAELLAVLGVGDRSRQRRRRHHAHPHTSALLQLQRLGHRSPAGRRPAQ
jgi:hypothetical protein